MLILEKKKVSNQKSKLQTHRYREQTSGYKWGEGRKEGQYRGRTAKGVIKGLHESMCVKLLKIVKHYRI